MGTTPPPIEPVDNLWALIVAGDYEFTCDPDYLESVLDEHYSFKGIKYLKNSPNGKQDVRDAITGWLEQKSDDNDLIFIFILSHGGGYHWLKKELYGPDNSIDGSRGDQEDEGNEFRETDVNIDFDGDGTFESTVWGGIDECIQIRMTENAFPEYYWDDEIKQDLASLSYRRLIFLSDCCFGGGFIDDLSAQNRIIMSPCNETTFGWSEEFPGTSQLVGCMSRPFINALNPEPQLLLDDYGYPIIDPETGLPILIDAFNLADINGDGVVSMWEAFRYAYQNNPAVEGFWWAGEFCQETPWLDDNGNGLPTFRDGNDVLDNDDGLLSYRTIFSSEIPKSTDANWDGKVDVLDMAVLGKAWMTGSKHPLYNPYVDFDGNDFINIFDFARIAKDWKNKYLTLEGTEVTGTPKISLDPNEIEVDKLQTFSLNVTITDVIDLYCYQFYLYYNASILNCTGVDLPPSHFLTPIDQSNILVIEQEYNNTYNATHGLISVAVTLRSDEPGKSGSGTLATINFVAKEFGSSILQFYDIVIGDSVPAAMPVIVVDGSATVSNSLTVLAEDQYGNSLTTGDVYIDGELVGFTGSRFPVVAGTHTVWVNDFWEAGQTGYRYCFTNWEDDSVDNPRTVDVVEARTLTAYFSKKYCPGDVDGNGVVDEVDLNIVNVAFGSVRGDTKWDSSADLNCDAVVDSIDVAIVASYVSYWVSPTGHVDDGGLDCWWYETKSYDDNEGSYALPVSGAYFAWLYLQHSAIQCNKIRVYWWWSLIQTGNVIVEVFRDGVWVRVCDEAQWIGWKEFSFAKGSVTQMRMKTTGTLYIGYQRLYEADFWKETVYP